MTSQTARFHDHRFGTSEGFGGLPSALEEGA